MALTQPQLTHFHEHGYVVVKGLIDPQTVAKLSQQVDGLHERMAAEPQPAKRWGAQVSWEEGLEGRPPRIRQLMHSERVSPIIDQVSRSDAVLSILQQLIGPDVYLYHSKLMMKAARDGTFTPWHQDWGYWRGQSIEPSQVNCMLSIDAANKENGAIRFVGGSQKQGPVEHGKLHSTSFNIGLEGGLDAFESTLVETEPGDAVFFGALVIHGSGPNSSDRHRRANTFAFDKAGNQKQGELSPEQWRCGQKPEAAPSA